MAPELSEESGDAAEYARPVVDLNAQIDDAMLALELAMDDGSENARIDIAAAQDEAHFAAAEMRGIGQHSGEAGGARAFGKRLLMRQDRP